MSNSLNRQLKALKYYSIIMFVWLIFAIFLIFYSGMGLMTKHTYDGINHMSRFLFILFYQVFWIICFGPDHYLNTFNPFRFEKYGVRGMEAFLKVFMWSYAFWGIYSLYVCEL